MSRHFPVIIEQDRDGVFIVECPTFQGCRSYGKTPEEALKNIREAIETCLDDEGTVPESEITFIGVRDLEIAG